MYSFQFVAEFFSSILIFLFGIYAYNKGRDKEQAKRFSLLLFSIGFFIFLDSLLHSQFVQDFRMLVYYIHNVGSTFIILSLGYFFMSFPREDRYTPKYKKLLVLFALLGSIELLVLFSGNWVKEIIYENNVSKIVFSHTLLSNVWIIFVISVLIGIIAPLVLRYKKSSGLDRSQLRLLVIGTGIGATISVILQPILPTITGITAFQWLYPLGFIPYFSLTIYSIARYRFMDIRFAIRSLTFKSVYIFLILLILAILLVLNIYVINTINLTLILLQVLVVSILIVGLSDPVSKAIEPRIDALLFTELVQTEKIYNLMLQSVNQSILFDEIKERIEKDLKIIFNNRFTKFVPMNNMPKFINAYFDAQEEPLVIIDELLRKEDKSPTEQDIINYSSNNETQVLLGIHSYSGIIGYLELGEKKHFDAYSSGEIKQLQSLSTYLGTAMENAKLVQNLEDDKETINSERKKLSIVFENIIDGVLAIDKFGRILFVNSAMERILNTTSEIVINSHFNEILILHKTDTNEIQTFNQIIENHSAQRDNLGESFILESNNQATKFVSMNIANISTSQPHEINYLFMIHDQTEQHQLEAMKLDFVSMAAHELRTPLTSVRGYAEWLSDLIQTGSKEEISKIIKRILTNATDLNNLIDNLLNVTQIENGQFKTNKHPLHIDQLATKIVDDFQLTAKNKNQALTITIPDKNTPIVLGDEFRIMEVFKNLISNALKYTQPGGEILIRLWNDGSYVYCSIEDNGEGIPESSLPYLFTKFYRVQTPLEAGSKGTGLGLYISNSIIKLHGGEIWVDSQIDKGSTFTFKLPIPSGEEIKEISKSSNLSIHESRSKLRLNPNRMKRN